ncbi:MAG: hypothetical protein PHW95_03520 [Patescibacteria group bacterium]|nr:hypothetical protein [Patescibacteria group bacterium]
MIPQMKKGGHTSHHEHQPATELRKALCRRKLLARKATRRYHQPVCWMNGTLVFVSNCATVPGVPEVLTPGQEFTPAEVAEAKKRGISVPQLRCQQAVAKQQQDQAAERDRQRSRRLNQGGYSPSRDHLTCDPYRRH